MSEDEIVCDKCGTINTKDNVYCTNCGNLLGISSRPPMNVTPTSPTTPTVKKKKLKLKSYHKVIIFFAVVIIVDLILSAIVLAGFGLPTVGFFPVLVGMFFLSLIVVGIFWGISASDSVTIADFEGCGYVIGGIIVAAIVIPIWIFTALGSIASAVGSAIGEAIGEAISNAFSNFFADLFEGIEIPGFEPFLFVLIFIALSLLTVYGYHLKAKRNNK